MAKLKKREIVILAIAALFVLYAVYVYLIADRQKGKKVKPDQETVKVEAVVSGITGELNKSKISDFDHYVIQRTQTDWDKNPFLKRELYRAWLAKDSKGKDGVAAVPIIYSGYIETGKNRLAVLNGIEYRVGEALQEEGYVLKKIMPSKVVIFDKRIGSNLEIPLQE
ncbi:MAG TPA: hypothetical protein PK424_06915 [Smithella sp.]|nr:hypothetical protein [Smithella sp.]